jgi:hypothetical protein
LDSTKTETAWRCNAHAVFGFRRHLNYIPAMGFRIAWVAVRSLSDDQVFERLGLWDTGEPGPVPLSPCSAAALDGGWTLVWIPSSDFPSFFDFSRLSHNAEVVLCRVNETIMLSAAEAWNDGHRAWLIEHNSAVNVRHLHAEGNAPAAFIKIRDETLIKQDESQHDANYAFDIPIELARMLTGFRHDDKTPLSWRALDRVRNILDFF